MKNYYNILELSFDATDFEIRKNYRRLAIKYHPDTNASNFVYEEKFKNLLEAYQSLRDPIKRQEYNYKFEQFFVDKSEFIFVNHQQQNDNNEDLIYKYNNIDIKIKWNFNKVFSFEDRQIDETPQNPPSLDYIFGKIPDNLDFFKFPKRIGNIAFGYSTLKTEQSLKSSIFGTKKYYANYVGINGFAEYECQKSRMNISNEFEYNFKDLTDLCTFEESTKHLYSTLPNTRFIYIWVSQKTQKTELVKSGDSLGDIGLNVFMIKAEAFWTTYLVDNLENTLNMIIPVKVYHHSGAKYTTLNERISFQI